MNKTFLRSITLTNYMVIGSFGLMIITANIYYQTTRTLWLLGVLALALFIKMKKNRARAKQLDERAEFIVYRALSAAFYCTLGAVLWFYTKEMTLEGHISTRTLVELLAGALGYLGALFWLNRRL